MCTDAHPPLLPGALTSRLPCPFLRAVCPLGCADVWRPVPGFCEPTLQQHTCSSSGPGRKASFIPSSSLPLICRQRLAGPCLGPEAPRPWGWRGELCRQAEAPRASEVRAPGKPRPPQKHGSGTQRQQQRDPREAGLLVPWSEPHLLSPSSLPFGQLGRGPTEGKSRPAATAGGTRARPSAELGSLLPTPCLIFLMDNPEKGGNSLSSKSVSLSLRPAFVKVPPKAQTGCITSHGVAHGVDPAPPAPAVRMTGEDPMSSPGLWEFRRVTGG